MIPIPQDDQGHPRGFDFNYDFWFDCVCERRVQVPAITYDLQCQGNEPYPVCGCGETIDISEAKPTVRDPSDIDHHDEEVDRHVWYHSSIYPDWPSLPAFRRDLAADLLNSLLEVDQHEKAIDEQSSSALHLGTYAAAVENMMRRTHDEPTPNSRYWLHQVEIAFQPGDLFPDVGGELSGWFGKVHMTELAKRDARAVRYINTHEAIGSISLAIDPQVIRRVRTIQVPIDAAILPAAEAGKQAATCAVAELSAAEDLRPDTAGVPKDQIFDSELDASISPNSGDLSSRSIAIAQQNDLYHDRQHEIWSSLENSLVDTYLSDVNTQVRARLTSANPTGGDPVKYHERFRAMAGPLMRPDLVVEQFETATWRTPN